MHNNRQMIPHAHILLGINLWGYCQEATITEEN